MENKNNPVHSDGIITNDLENSSSENRTSCWAAKFTLVRHRIGDDRLRVDTRWNDIEYPVENVLNIAVISNGPDDWDNDTDQMNNDQNRTDGQSTLDKRNEECEHLRLKSTYQNITFEDFRQQVNEG